MTTTGTPAKRAVIYCRISDDQLGLERGIDRQLADCQKLADAENYDVVAVFPENDISAYNKKKKRPKFERTIQMVHKGDADVIIVWHMERYLRRSNDLNRLIELVEHGVCEVVSVISGRFDLTTADGKMQARIAVAVSEQTSEHRAELRKRANIDRAERGEWKWMTANRSFGYDTNMNPLEPEATAIRQAVIDVLAGKSLRGIARQWNDAGITTTCGNEWNGTQVRNAIIKPRIAALIVHKGKTYPGTWTPLIDPDTHRHLVNFLTNPARTNGRVSWDQKHLGSGLYLCGVCGAKMISESGRSYTCRRAKHCNIVSGPLDTLVVGAILGWFAKENAHLLINSPVDLVELSTQREAVQAELDEIAEAKKARQITLSQAITMNEEPMARARMLDAQMAAATGTSAATALVHTSQKAWATNTDAGEAIAAMWESMDVTQQAQAIDEVATVTIQSIAQAAANGGTARRGAGFYPDRILIDPRRPPT